MSATADKAPATTDLVTVTIDGIETQVDKGTLIIRAAEQVGIEIPRFCDHPAAQACGRVPPVPRGGGQPGRPRRRTARPSPSRRRRAPCRSATAWWSTRSNTSEEAERAQKGVMELLLINHPLDCPVCDKGGECPLQNQAMSHGRGESRFVDVKRVFEKPLPLSSEILLDRERCIMCQRCTRFSKEIAGDPFIDLQNRGAMQQIGTFDEDVLGFDGYGPVGDAAEDESGRAFSSYYSGNTIQICPVGALTSSAYRFRSRPFDLVSSPGISEHDSSGSAIRTDHRRGKILRRLADNDPVVNEDWITDKDRFAFTWQNQADRLTQPLVRKDGELVEVVVARGSRRRRRGPRTPPSASRVTPAPTRRPRAWASCPAAASRWKTPTRTASSRGWCSTPTTSMPAPASPRTRSSRSSARASPAPAWASLSPNWRRRPPCCSWASSPRTRAASCSCASRSRWDARRCITVGSYLSRGAEKLGATLLPAVPGREAAVVASLKGSKAAYKDLREPGSIIIVGERAAGCARHPDRRAGARQAGQGQGGVDSAPGRRARSRSRRAPFPACCRAAATCPRTAGRDAVAKAWGATACPAPRVATPTPSSPPLAPRRSTAW